MSIEEVIEKLETEITNTQNMLAYHFHGYGNPRLERDLSTLEYALKLLKKVKNKECEVNYLGYVSNQGATWETTCGHWEVVETDAKDKPDDPIMFRYDYCRNCGGKIKRSE